MAIVLRITHDGGHKFLDITKAKRPMSFGRSEECDYTIKNDGCSGEHVELTLKSDHILVKDLESKNGTILNGNRINKNRLYVDDIIQIGDVFIELHTESMTTIEKEIFKNQRADGDRSAGELTIPDMAESQSNKDKLVSNNKPRHGFNELTNITGIALDKISNFIKRKKK